MDYKNIFIVSLILSMSITNLTANEIITKPVSSKLIQKAISNKNEQQKQKLFEKGCKIFKEKIKIKNQKNLYILFNIIFDTIEYKESDFNYFPEEELRNTKTSYYNVLYFLDRYKNFFLKQTKLKKYPFNNLIEDDKIALNYFLTKSLQVFLSPLSDKSFNLMLNNCKLYPNKEVIDYLKYGHIKF